MKLRNAPRVIGAIAGVVVFSGLTAADPIVGAGQFNLAGTVYVTDNSFLFGYSAGPTARAADQTAGVLLPATGSFSDLKSRDIATMHNLLTPSNGDPFGPGPVAPDSAFLLRDFIQLPDGIDVDLTAMRVNLSVRSALERRSIPPEASVAPSPDRLLSSNREQQELLRC